MFVNLYNRAWGRAGFDTALPKREKSILDNIDTADPGGSEPRVVPAKYRVLESIANDSIPVCACKAAFCRSCNPLASDREGSARKALAVLRRPDNELGSRHGQMQSGYRPDHASTQDKNSSGLSQGATASWMVYFEKRLLL